MGNCFSFAFAFRIIGKTIKTLGLYNNTHLLDQSSLDVSSIGVFRTLLMHFSRELFLESAPH